MNQAANLVLAITIASMRKDSPLRRTLRFIFHILMLLAWGVYSYRDLYPLITYSKHPLDPDFLPQPVVWTRFSLLTIVAIIVPLIQPSQYRPVDPMHPSEEPNAEQTASLFSYVFYIFMDRIILQAWRTNAIAYDELPPLPDYDRASWLAQNSLLKLHPVRRQEIGLKSRHLFVCLMSVYWKTYCMLALMIVIKSVMEFAAPLGINRLLTYLQADKSKGEGGDIRPWFWILWLFVGPTASSLAWQYYVFLTTRVSPARLDGTGNGGERKLTLYVRETVLGPRGIPLHATALRARVEDQDARPRRSDFYHLGCPGTGSQHPGCRSGRCARVDQYGYPDRQ